jgi:predicted nucleic acid-binding protein
VDLNKFPARLLLDTGILIRALEHDREPHKSDPRTRDCRDLWVALASTSKTDVLIAAPSLLEYLRGPKAPEPPIVPGVIYASFDYLVAQDMASWATTATIKEVRDRAANTRRIVTYDALIVGTARFYGADFIVSYDEDVQKLAAKARVGCCEPAHFKSDPLLFGRE